MKKETVWIYPKKVPNSFLNSVYKSMSDLEATILYNRQIDNRKKLDFFKTNELDIIPSRKKLYDAKKASFEILQALKENKKIFIHGDYDADGICATALLWDFLYRKIPKLISEKTNSTSQIEPDITPYIPDRIEEGYGLSEKSIQKMLKQKAQLIITVDCGIRDSKLIKKYQSDDVKFIITDHHQPPEDISKQQNCTIVHQLFPDKEYPYKEICGTFVIYLLILAIIDNISEVFEDKINKKDSKKGKTQEKAKDTNYYLEALDLVAISTITDIMPLSSLNRVIVKKGLEILSKSKRLGLKALLKSSGLESKELSAYDIGFILGPRLNATGRIGNPMDALKLLLTENESFAVQIAENLNNLNSERQSLTEKFLNIVDKKLELSFLKNSKQKSIFEIEENIPEGIIGLVAGKIQEKYNRPTIIASAKIKDGTIKEVRGSARSIPGFNITDAIGQYAKYLEKFGGHSQASGFTCIPGKEMLFRKKFLAYAEKEILEESLVKKIKISAEIIPSDIDVDNMEMIKKLEPYGFGNPKPVFLMKKLAILDISILTKKNSDYRFLKVKAKADGQDFIELMFFNYLDFESDSNAFKINDFIDVVGFPDLNEWNGIFKPQFFVNDWKLS